MPILSILKRVATGPTTSGPHWIYYYAGGRIEGLEWELQKKNGKHKK